MFTRWFLYYQHCLRQAVKKREKFFNDHVISTFIIDFFKPLQCKSNQYFSFVSHNLSHQQVVSNRIKKRMGFACSIKKRLSRQRMKKLGGKQQSNFDDQNLKTISRQKMSFVTTVFIAARKTFIIFIAASSKNFNFFLCS